MLERWTDGALAPQEDGQGPLERYKVPLTAASAVLLVIGLAVWLARRPAALPVTIPTAAAASRVLKVHVAGAVSNPGLYELSADSRVQEALAAAGGPLPSGDASRLNLAARLRDGQQVFVPVLATPASASEGAPARGASPTPGGIVNLNTASQAELESLPGIGPATARKIVQHRADRGPFQSIEELRSERLVTAATWERLKERVAAP